MTCHPIGSSHIVLTTDLSPESEKAFGATLELAEVTGARVTLLYVIGKGTRLLHGAPLLPSGPELEDEEERARHRLQELAAGLGSPVSISTATIASEDVAAGIVGYAREHGADLISMSTHGRAGLRRAVLGSVAEQVLRHSHLPMLLVPVRGERQRPGKCIVVPTDLSEESRRAFEPVADLARRLDLPVVLVSVVVEPQVAPHGSVLAAAPTYPDLDAIRGEREQKLRELASELGEEVEVEVVALCGTGAASAIVEQAKTSQAAFIAMATHGRSGIRRLLMGSVTEAVLRHSETPVLVFPPPLAGDEEPGGGS